MDEIITTFCIRLVDAVAKNTFNTLVLSRNHIDLILGLWCGPYVTTAQLDIAYNVYCGSIRFYSANYITAEGAQEAWEAYIEDKYFSN